MVKIQSSLNSNKKTAFNKPLIATCLFSMLTTAFVVLLSFILLGFAPFGDQAFLYKDGQQQMIDLYCWYKDALAGKFTEEFTWFDIDSNVLNGYTQKAEGVTFPQGPLGQSVLEDSVKG